jgi:PAS domain S-box-containing protein
LELFTFKTSNLEEHLLLFKSTLTVQCFLWIGFGWFVHYYTRAKRYWGPAAITVLYIITLIINFFSPTTILFQGNTELSTYHLANGEIIHILTGSANSLRIIADLAWILLILVTFSNCIQFGRKGNIKHAVILGATTFLCLGLGYLHGTLIDLRIADPPYLGSFLFLPLSLVMSYTLATDVVRASVLSKKVKQAESRWRNLLEKVNLLVLGVDININIVYINPFFLKLTGYKRDEIINQPFVNILKEEDREVMLNRITDVLSHQNNILAERLLPILDNKGNSLEISWSNVMISDSEDSLVRIIGIGKDITGQREAEGSRDKALNDLQSLKDKLEEENVSLKEIIQTEHVFEEIIGNSNGLHYVLNKVQQVAETDATVLVLGETGTGKELIAKAIHKQSKRFDKPFIRVNCAAIPADLVESELFGHEPGSFTNAVTLRLGKFELAQGGTIFLDEVSEMPLDIQAKLLSVLQESELERVGGSEVIPIDVRVISATNRDLSHEVGEGRFRADLFYRLNVYPVTIPPLRNRKEDIPLLVNHYIALFNKKFGKHIEEVPATLMDTLLQYEWPGNVRELRNLLERAVITCNHKVLHMPSELKILNNNGNGSSITQADTPFLPLIEVEKNYILRALRHANWQIGGKKGAASLLQLNPSTLRSRVKKHGLEKS